MSRISFAVMYGKDAPAPPVSSCLVEYLKLAKLVPDYVGIVQLNRNDRFAGLPHLYTEKGVSVVYGDLACARYMARSMPEAGMYSEDPAVASQIDSWVDLAAQLATASAPSALALLDDHLQLRTFLVGYTLTLADLAIYAYLYTVNPADLSDYVYLARWLSFLHGTPKFDGLAKKLRKSADSYAKAQAKKAGGGGGGGGKGGKGDKGKGKGAAGGGGGDPFLAAIAAKEAALADAKAKGDDAAVTKLEKTLEGMYKRRDAAKDKSAQGSAYAKLKGAVDGQVVTRFPPEPSGYLHIGHAKAAMLNYFYAKDYHGKLILRFDDTNPAKENQDFVDAIVQDLAFLGITADQMTFTSDSFDLILGYAKQLIESGHAYVDDTPVELQQEWRRAGKESPNRSISVEENLALWQEMVDGTPKGEQCCLRAKIDMASENACMRDPTLARVILEPHHHRLGDKYKVYPTYDLACPIVDSVEGVTHALRTNEYADREEQFYWVIDALGLRKPTIEDYSRLSFVHTVLSKRTLTLFVDRGFVDGWDDPRMPTVRGITRRGLQLEALTEFIRSQGASKRSNTQSWDKLWAINRKLLDPVVPRYTCVERDTAVRVRLTDLTEVTCKDDVPAHNKNADVGTKTVYFAPTVLLDAADAKTIARGEEVTLMNWGNCVIDQTDLTDGAMTGHTNLEGDFTATKKKLTWLAETENLTEVHLIEYGHLITKSELAEGDDPVDFYNTESKQVTVCYGDADLRNLPAGTIVQILRRGYFKIDVAADGGGPVVMHDVPDGKANAMSNL